MNDIEKTLIEKCKKGDIEAFEKLIFDYQKKVFNICYRFMQNHEDASEIAQEVFIKVYKSIINFMEESKLSTWIYKIAATTCIDELRKRKNINTVSIDNDELAVSLPDNSNNPHDVLSKNELKRELHNAINSLNDDHRDVIILRDMQGFSYEEIAKMLKLPLGTVKSRIKRGREGIKQYLIKNGNFFDKVSSN